MIEITAPDLAIKATDPLDESFDPAMPDWVKTFPGAVTISDRQHRIIYLNDKAAATWAHLGGRKLVGQSMLACHNAHSITIIESLLANSGSNVYTIEKQGTRKLIYQTVWQDSTGTIGGLVELSMVVPVDMPHFIRD